jgi:hypothetical protein
MYELFPGANRSTIREEETWIQLYIPENLNDIFPRGPVICLLRFLVNPHIFDERTHQYQYQYQYPSGLFGRFLAV